MQIKKLPKHLKRPSSGFIENSSINNIKEYSSLIENIAWTNEDSAMIKQRGQ